MFFAILGIMTFVSCSQEDWVLPNDDLSINSQVPLTRGASEQDIHQQRDYSIFSYGKDECCAIALVELTGEKRTFDSQYSASDCYNGIMKYAKSLTDENGIPRYTGGAMDHDLFLEIGQHYKLINERITFNNKEEVEAYFSDKKNNPKVIRIDVWDETTQKYVSHVATVDSINRKKGTVKYNIRTKNGTQEQTEISIYEIKDVWVK